ncbi:MAG: exodeoxyribonuclease V subunit beta [Spirochaetaceae bacterium]|nr:MAG: exodeoxyribonuclease V subunit beta [Spirochaetaceae bacterium]
MKPERLEALTFPLRGSSLIEAGAGTGKTYTIAQLYTRLVLGHGQQGERFHRPLEPREILVVTFAEAAKLELRDRIRRRLTEAAAFLAGEASTNESSLAGLRDSLNEEERTRAVRRLLGASEAMDEAAIFTIHGWCLRTLRRYAFESGLGFTRETADDTTVMLEDAVKDYWRSTFYGVSAGAAEVLTSIFAEPGALQSGIRPLLGSARGEPRFGDQPRKVPDDVASLLEDAAEERDRCRSLYRDARKIWRENRTDLHAILQGLRPFMSGNTYRGVRDDTIFNQWLHDLDQWGQEESEDDPAPAILPRLAPDAMNLNRGGVPPTHPFFTLLGEWRQCEEAQDLRPLATDLMLHAARGVGARFEEAKRSGGLLDFDDMLSALDGALSRDDTGYLAESIRREFPVVLVDEFQDTDEVQYRILDAVYRIRENNPATGLFLIGDPKQAIYRFRGADIHSYLRARGDTAGRHFSLTTNYRSTKALVEATNAIFSAADRHDQGPFLFGRGEESEVPFLPAEPRETATDPEEVLVLDGSPAPPVTIWTMPELEGPIATGEFVRVLAEQTGAEIARRLGDGGGLFRRGTLPPRPVEAQDIAVLVRNGKQAEAVLQALRRRGIAGVYLSARDSVFSTPEAIDIRHWLRAILQPEEESYVRAALAAPAMGLTLAELETISASDHLRDAHMNRFAGYHDQLHGDGVLPAFRSLLRDYRVSAHLLSRSTGEGGERSLTNLLHLAEWLHQLDAQVESRHELLRLLAEQGDEPGEEQILRLERDDQCVRVVTIYKAKGLQYEIVLAPFLCVPPPDFDSLGAKGPPRPVVWHHREQGRIVEFDQANAPEAREAMRRELLSEEMRLFYVALTRARHATFFTVAPVFWKKKEHGIHGTGIGYTLTGGEPVSSNRELLDAVERMTGGSSGFALVPITAAEVAATPLDANSAETGHAYTDPAGADPAGTPPADGGKEYRARVPLRRSWERWWIASYTALGAGRSDRTDHTPYPPEPELLSQAVAAEEPQAAPDGEPPSASGEMDRNVHRFPAGAGPGTFLHELIEEFSREGFMTIAQTPHERRERIERACGMRGWEEWSPLLDAWMETFLLSRFALEHPLVPGELRQYQAEMEFLFPAAGVSLDALDGIVRSSILPGRARPRWSAPPMQGMFKGFIDLVFLHHNRYYLADWKSNRLGPDDDAYSEEALQEAMLEKRYDLQLSLYTLALHRHLRRRIPDYDYDRHFGGTLYFFLRGIHGPGKGLLFHRLEKSALQKLDDLFRGSDER